MSESTALTTTTETQVAVSRPAPVSVMPSAAKTVAAMFQRGPGVPDPIRGGPLQGYSRSLIDTFKDTVAKGADDNQLFLFINQAINYNLDPTRKEIWCVNMAGQGQPAQWMIAPSRDGYLRMAQRHPNFDQILSGVVREGDHYEIDKANGHVVHRTNSFNKSGAIIGAWCIVRTRDRKSYADDVPFAEVKRNTKVWDNFAGPMTEKTIQTRVLRKAGLFSDLYVSDKVWEQIEDVSADALLVDPTQAEYVDGFAVGVAPQQLAAAPVEQPPENGRGNRNEAGKALGTVIKLIQESVDGSNWGDALEARAAWLKSKNLPLIAHITDAEAVWDLVEVLQGEDGAEEFSSAVTAARDARWTAEAIAKEMAEAGGQPAIRAAIDTTATQVTPPQHIFVSSADDDAPDTLAEGEEL